ncbi:alpha/beta-hydrolase family protein [Geodermatophilus sp. SYSU D00691]
MTGLATGVQYLLSVATGEALTAAAGFLAGDDAPPARRRAVALAVDCAAVPLGLAVMRALPPRPGDPLLRGAARQVAWRSGATGLAGAALRAAQAGTRALDARLGLAGRLAAVPLAVPVGLALSYLLDRRRPQAGDDVLGRADVPPALRSLLVAGGVVGGLTAGGYGEHALADLAGRRLAAVLPGPAGLWRAAGHAGSLAGLAAGASALWHRAMRRIEAGTSADVPVLERDEAERWVPATVSGGPGSVVPWASLGREGRRHALATVRPEPLPTRPDGTPDLSVETVMGTPARAAPVQVYVGLDSAPTARERVDLALAELERTSAFDRSLLVLVSPTGTGYVNYVAVAALQYLALGDVATVTMQYSRRPSPLSLGMVAGAREQNRLLWLRVLERVRERAARPRVVLFGESLGAHTSQDVFLHWGTLGLEALGIDRALWIGTPYGSGWMHQVTGADRLDVDRERVAVVNDAAQLEALRPRPRYVLLSHDNDGVTRFGPDLLWSPPAWLGPDRPRPELVADGSPRGIPPGLRWRPVTTFFQSLVDMKNAQVPGPYRAWAHDYRADLPRVLAAVYGLPATAEQLDRVEEALRLRESVRERLFAGAPA